MNKKTHLLIFLGFMIAMFFATILYRSYSAEKYREYIKSNVVAKLKAVNKCDLQEISIKYLIPENISDICIQPAYMAKSDFERESGKDADGYEVAIHDGQIIWWLYESNGLGIAIDIPSSELLSTPEVKSPLCFSKNNTTIVFSCKSNKIYYQMKGR